MTTKKIRPPVSEGEYDRTTFFHGRGVVTLAVFLLLTVMRYRVRTVAGLSIIGRLSQKSANSKFTSIYVNDELTVEMWKFQHWGGDDNRCFIFANARSCAMPQAFFKRLAVS